MRHIGNETHMCLKSNLLNQIGLLDLMPCGAEFVIHLDSFKIKFIKSNWTLRPHSMWSRVCYSLGFFCFQLAMLKRFKTDRFSLTQSAKWSFEEPWISTKLLGIWGNSFKVIKIILFLKKPMSQFFQVHHGFLIIFVLKSDIKIVYSGN